MKVYYLPFSQRRPSYIEVSTGGSHYRIANSPREAFRSIETRKYRWLQKKHPHAAITLDDVRCHFGPVNRIERSEPEPRDIYLAIDPDTGKATGACVLEIDGQFDESIRLFLIEQIASGKMIDLVSRSEAVRRLQEG